MVSVHVFNRAGQLVGPVEISKLTLSDNEWRRRLSPEQFRILRASGTERPFCGTLLDNKRVGVYACAGCGCRFFRRTPSFIRVPAGRASFSQLRRATSPSGRTTATGWFAWRSTVLAATATWGTSFPTARRRRACGIVSTPSRCGSCRATGWGIWPTRRRSDNPPRRDCPLEANHVHDRDLRPRRRLLLVY